MNERDTSPAEQAISAAQTVRGAVKTGKVVAGALKGASTGGVWGAAAGAVWESRHALSKLAIVFVAVMLIPVVLVTMLPSIIFGGWATPQETVILNDDAAILRNVSQAQQTVWAVVYEAHSSVVSDIQSQIANLGEGCRGIMVDNFTGSLNANSLALLSQYSAGRDYKEISIPDLEQTVRNASAGLFSYTVTSYTDGQGVTTYRYIVTCAGDDYFADEVFHLDEKQKQIAQGYASNLSLYLYGSTGEGFGVGAEVSAEVLQYASLIRQYARQYGISEYFDLICAVMMAETGGQGTDVMASAESGYNTRYPATPGGIEDPAYSIDCGVHVLADVLELAEVTSPTDTGRISLALQGYNFGPGYITWALEKYGGYTQENAIEFSNLMKARMGWEVYGNPQYVQSVMRYYLYPIGGGAEGWGSPFVGRDWRSVVTSEFGGRYDPIEGYTDFHTGIDIGYPEGTPVNVVKSGYVESVSSQGSYGNHIVVNHGNGVKTLYAHLSQILVSPGQRVIQGEVIALVGQTGRVTGPHLHLNVEINGELQNPRDYLN